MKTSEHVTRNQIAAFGAGSLATSDSRTVCGHLIRCVECRSLLPMPDPAKVWTAVTSEHNFDESPTLKSRSLKQSYAQTVAGLFGMRNRLVWAGGLLVLVLSLTALFIFSGSNRQGNETEMARSFEPENPVRVLNNNGSNEVNTAIPIAPGNDPGFKETNPITTDEALRRRKPSSTATSTSQRTTSGVKRNISTTRGTTVPCIIGKSIEVELTSFRADLILRWRPVPRAAKYHLYVSDDSEILVDEFETDQDTSYVLKKPLDPAKSYKWKIVVTLESGQKLYVDAQKFTAKDFQSSLNRSKSRVKSSTRCLAN